MVLGKAWGGRTHGVEGGWVACVCGGMYVWDKIFSKYYLRNYVPDILIRIVFQKLKEQCSDFFRTVFQRRMFWEQCSKKV